MTMQMIFDAENIGTLSEDRYLAMIGDPTLDPGALVTKGGPGSGFHGHAGRIGYVGGSIGKGNGTFTVETFAGFRNLREGERIPTEAEIQTFTDSVNSMDPEIKRLFAKNQKVTLSIENGRAENYGYTVYLDEKYLNSGVANHEFLHATMNANKRISNTIQKKYDPPFFYKHCDHYGADDYAAKCEQLVMTLNVFNADRDTWIGNLQTVEHWEVGNHTWQEAEAQADAARQYLQGIGIW